MQPELFIEWAKEERTRRGLSQRDLAELSGIHHSTIAQVEQGVRQPSADFVIKIDEVFDQSPKEVMNHLYLIGARKKPVDMGDDADAWWLAKCRRYARGASRKAIEAAVVLFETGIKMNQ